MSTLHLDSHDLQRRLAPLFSRPEVDLVVLFGSRARGCATPRSDIDLGVLAGGDLDSLRIEAIRLLATDRVDLANLRTAPPLLAMAVATGGRPLHERQPGAFASFASLALRRYEDTAKFRKLRERDPRLPCREGTLVSPVDREILRRKLETITANLGLLTPLRRLSLADYQADVYRRKAVERILQEIVEAAADINAHLLVSSGRPAPESLHASFIALGDLGVLDRRLAATLAPSAGLRNRLVHQYDFIDHGKVLAAVRAALDHYPLYVARVEQHLGTDG